MILAMIFIKIFHLLGWNYISSNSLLPILNPILGKTNAEVLAKSIKNVVDLVTNAMSTLKYDKIFTLIGYVTVITGMIVFLIYVLKFIKCMILSLIDSPPKIKVDVSEIEKADKLLNQKKFNMKTFYSAAEEQKTVPLFDPSTLDYFGDIPVTSATEVNNIVARAKEAQKVNY
jgi:hypothetical protein